MGNDFFTSSGTLVVYMYVYTWRSCDCDNCGGCWGGGVVANHCFTDAKYPIEGKRAARLPTLSHSLSSVVPLPLIFADRTEYLFQTIRFTSARGQHWLEETVTVDRMKLFYNSSL